MNQNSPTFTVDRNVKLSEVILAMAYGKELIIEDEDGLVRFTGLLANNHIEFQFGVSPRMESDGSTQVDAQGYSNFRRVLRTMGVLIYFQLGDQTDIKTKIDDPEPMAEAIDGSKPV